MDERDRRHAGRLGRLQRAEHQAVDDHDVRAPGGEQLVDVAAGAGVDEHAEDVVVARGAVRDHGAAWR